MDKRRNDASHNPVWIKDESMKLGEKDGNAGKVREMEKNNKGKIGIIAG